MPMKDLQAIDLLEPLESKLAYIPGGRDYGGRSLIVVNVPPELQPTTKPWLKFLIEYFLAIFSEETKQKGLVVLVDARRGTWRVARSCTRLVTDLLGSRAASVIVLRPDGFWDKRVDNCTKSHKEDEPAYIKLIKLPMYIDISQLPYEFGGNRSYDHTEWIQTRLKVDSYIKDAEDLLSKMSNLHEKLISLEGIFKTETESDLESFWEIGMELVSKADYILPSGRNLASNLSRTSSQDVMDSARNIHRILDSIELKQAEIESSWTLMERSLDTARVIDDLEEGVTQVTNWILGPADAMLNSCCQVGFDVTSSEELRRKHEKLELECRDTYGRYAELLHKIDNIPNLPEDLKSQRDFMDFVCRSFATRLERRRNVLITSQRFFRLVSEYFDKTSEVFDKLVMSGRALDFSQASIKLEKLEKSQTTLEALERELVKEGEKLSDILSMPVKDALGRDVQVDYGEDIINVRDILDATNARKNIFNDSVELQKLTLKQMSLIYTYENDAEQAVKWLNDLFNVLLENHVDVGCNSLEIQAQKEEHQSFQETAKGTYNYGCQLVNGARVLRMSCKLPLDSNSNLHSRLRQAWKQLRSVGEEQLTRLRVCAVFHRSVEDHCSKLRELITTVGSLKRAMKADDPVSESRTRAEIRDILAEREKLLLEVGRMVRLGRLLRTRLKEPLCHQRVSEVEDGSTKGDNLTAVEAISAKLAEVTRLAEKLDARLCEAGARTRPVSIPKSTSSTITSTSPAPVLASILSTSVHHTPASSRPVTASSITTSLKLSKPSKATAVPSTAFSYVSPEFTSASVSVGPGKSEVISSTCTSTTVSTSGINSEIMSNNVTIIDESVVDDGKHSSEMWSTQRVDSATPVTGGIHKDLELNENEENAAEDMNVDGYVTATECSITPTARSRSQSFVTSPECEDITVPISSDRENEVPSRAAKPDTIEEAEITKTSVENSDKKSNVDTKEPEPTDRSVSLQMINEKRSDKVLKEVTETTTLRVTHDIRLDVASYQVTSNTVQAHRQHFDVKELKDEERVEVSDTPHKEMNGFHHDTATKEPDKHHHKMDQEIRTDSSMGHRGYEEDPNHTMSKEFKEISISLKEVSKRHEDSGIEMSPLKKDYESNDFLERIKKVSSKNACTQNEEENTICCCTCSCVHGTVCYDRSVTIDSALCSKFTEVTVMALADENRLRLSLTNPS